MKKPTPFMVVGTAIGSAVTAAYIVYRQQRRRILPRLLSDSQVIQTPLGPVEFWMAGVGPAVLILHGGGGAYPLGKLFSFPKSGFRFIAPSRPGYLRTPLESGPSPEEQADLFAAMLDELGIEKVAVFGMSGGGPATLQFALRHPDRCWSLVLLSAISQPISTFTPLMELTTKIMPHSDFLVWLLLNTPIRDLLAGQKHRAQTAGSREKQVLFRKLMETLFPISLQLPGAFNDLNQIDHLPEYPLDQINVPTIVIHGDCDSIVPISHGQHTATSILGSKFVVVPEGDHLCFITHMEQVRPAIINFLKIYS